MHAKFACAAFTRDEIALTLSWEGVESGACLTPPGSIVAVTQAHGAEIGVTWRLMAAQGEIAYTVPLPVPSASPGMLHGEALAACQGGVLVALCEALQPTMPPDAKVTWVKTGGCPVHNYDGILLAGAVQVREAGRGNGAVRLAILPDADAAQVETLLPNLTREVSRLSPFRMSATGTRPGLLLGVGGRLALTPPAWAEVGTDWMPLQVSHALVHAAALLARPLDASAWWAHEGIAEYVARVEAARHSPERDAELRTWLGAAYCEHGSLAMAPAKLRGDRLPVVSALVVHVLSKRILAITGHSRSLFHLVDELNRRFAGGGGYTNDDLVAVLFSLTGRDFAPFFASHVLGTQPLPAEPFEKL